LAVASAATFSSGPGQTYAVSVFLDPMIDDLNWSRTSVSGLYTAGSLTAAGFMVFIGRALDRWGARIMLVILGVLFGLAALLMSQVQHQVHLYLGFAALRILGQGSLTMVPSTLVAIWFIRKRGKATALMSVGMALSHALFPIMIHLLINWVGWRGAWVALAFVIWIMVILPSFIFVRRSPESIGLAPDGELFTTSDGESQSTQRKREIDFTLGQALKTRSLWLLLFTGMSASLISTGLTFHQVSVMASRGLDAGVAASVFVAIGPFSLAGALIAGILVDRFPTRFVLAGVQVLLFMSMLWIFVISSHLHALVYGAMLGFTGGLGMTAMTVVWANYYGRKHLGAIRGVGTASMVGSAALGPLPFGYIFDVTGSYEFAILVFLFMPVACFVAAILAFPPRRDERLCSGVVSSLSGK
jgi:sugar phosphate permease